MRMLMSMRLPRTLLRSYSRQHANRATIIQGMLHPQRAMLMGMSIKMDEHDSPNSSTHG